MERHAKSKLSPTQERVIKALDTHGNDPVRAAKVLKISTNGVYGHLRRIEAKGHDVSKYRSRNGSTPRRSRKGTAKAASVEAHVKNAIDAGKKRQSEIAKEIATNRTEISVLETSNTRLKKEGAALATKITDLGKLA